MNDTLPARGVKDVYGKSPLFTDEAKEKIYEALLAGNNYSDACRLAKVPVEMGQGWRQHGQRELACYVALCGHWDGDINTVPTLGVWGLYEQCVQWASAGYRANLGERAMGLADKGQWGMEMRLNEARHRREFARQQTMNVNQKTTHTVVKRIELVVVGGDNWKQGALHDGSLTLPALPSAEAATEDADTVDTHFAED